MLVCLQWWDLICAGLNELSYGIITPSPVHLNYEKQNIICILKALE